MKKFCRKVLANLIIIVLLISDILPLGIGLVSYAEEQDNIEYSVKFVELTEQSFIDQNSTEGVSLEETPSDAVLNEDFSLLDISEENTQIGYLDSAVEDEIQAAETEIIDGDIANEEVEAAEEIKEVEIEQIDDTEITNNEENLFLGPAIEIRIKINGQGYLKNGKVEIKNYESQLFKIREDEKLDKNIYSIQDNKIKLNQINNNYEYIAYVPIEIKDTEAIDINMLQSGTTFNFSATYVGNEGNAEIITYSEVAMLNLENNYDIGVNSLVEKYIPYVSQEGNNALVQIKVIGSKNGVQSLPVQKTSYEIELPQIEGTLIEDVNVFALNTAYTNGLVDSEVQFSVENWDYSDGIVNISLENNPRDGLYYKSTGNDEFIISFTYKDIPEVIPNFLDSNTTMKTEVFTSTGSLEKACQNNFQFNLAEANTNIITYDVSGKTREISKGYVFGNINSPEHIPVEYENSVNINISRVDLLEEINIFETDEYYENEQGRKYSTNYGEIPDSFYKEVILNKSSLDNVLGNSGSMELVTEDGDSLIVINKDTPEDGDGFVRVAFDNNIVDKVNFIIKNPEEDGIINITAIKNIDKTSYDKTAFMEFKALVSEYSALAKLDMGIETDMGSTNVVTILKDTMSNAQISINKEDISTLVNNENIELSIVLNNANDESDMFSNPVFEVTFPDEIRDVEITDYNLFYGNDELIIENVEEYTNTNGNQVIRVCMKGNQTRYTAGDSNNGTKVVLNLNILTNTYQASTNSKIKMNYYNEDATEYGITDNMWNTEKDPTLNVLMPYTGYAETLIKIVAPEGIVNINEYSSYNENRELMSARQGFKEDYIETFSNEIIATNTIISINNTGNNIENYKILGRTAFEGNTSVITKAPIGTNITAPMISSIREDSLNKNTFTIYYSENGEATEDITLPENAWVLIPEDFRKVKSFLIVANETVEEGSTVIFEYSFEIPGNLRNLIDIGSTFATCCFVNGNNNWNEADKIILTTGEEPVLNVSTYANTDLETAFEGQRIIYTTRIKNEGRISAKNVELEFSVPEGTTYVNEGILDASLEKVLSTVPEIKAGETVYKNYEIEVNKIQTVSDIAEIEPKTVVGAEALETNITIVPEKKIKVKKSEVQLGIDSDKTSNTLNENEIVTYTLKVSNIDEIELKGCDIVVEIPDELEIMDSYEEKYSKGSSIRGESGKLEVQEKTLSWHEDNIGIYKIYKIEAKTKYIDKSKQDVALKFKLKSKSLNDEYIANEYKQTIVKPILETNFYTNSKNKYIKEGESVQFVLNMKNVGEADVSSLKLQNSIPKELSVTGVSYYIDGNYYPGIALQDAEVNLSLGVGQETQVVVNCVANNLLNNESEKMITNSWTISGENFSCAETERLQTIIEQNPDVPDNSYEDVFTPTINNNESEKRYEVYLNKEDAVEEEIKKFKITGIAFEDLNKNGEYDKGEQVLENVVAKLCDAKTQKIIAQTVTNKAGEYLFENLDKGEYYIKYEFDKEYYSITAYKKLGIRENKNSDAILSNGKAVTDKIKIKETSVSDMNIGLVKAGLFDLEIDANVNRFVVFDGKDSRSYAIEDGKMAKFELFGKDIDKSARTVEYTIKVTNKGEIPGYAKQIKCDFSEGDTFDGTINQNWYSSSDGEIYTNILENVVLNPGETKEIKLYMYKDKNDVGLYTNNFEISKKYNEFAIEDNNQNNNITGATYVVTKTKTINFVVYVLVIAITLGMLIVILFIAKYFMETGTAKEYEALEKAKEDNK